MPYTMDDFLREYFVNHFNQLTPEEHRKALMGLSPEQSQDLHAYLQELLKTPEPSPQKGRNRLRKRREHKR